MAVAYRPDPPDAQKIRLSLVDEDPPLAIDRWVSYQFKSDFLTPSDGFSFVLGTPETGLPEQLRNALKLGAGVRLHIDNLTLADGYIDSVEVSADRSGGSQFIIHGRDRLGQTLDTVADPRFQFPSGGTLADLLKRLFTPFGWSDDAHFVTDNIAARDARTGGTKAIPISKGKKPKPLNSYVLHQTKPYNHESVFHFASRVAQRFGLWIWVSPDGSKLVVGKPDYDQEPAFVLHRGSDGEGNILAGSVKFDLTNQPSVIIADSFSGGGEFGKGRCLAYIVNPILGLDEDGEHTKMVADLLAKYPGAVENTLPGASFPFRATFVPFRPMFLHDDESRTQEQLNNFVKRQMSLLYRSGVACQYVVEGHGQTVDDKFVAWAPDTVVDVQDDVAGFRERMYVLGVTLAKHRVMGGTTTHLDLVRLHSLTF